MVADSHLQMEHYMVTVRFMSAERAAFFDLDRTLIDVNSGYLWAKHERHEGNISTLQFGKAVAWTVLYHLSLIDLETAIEQATRHYAGVTRESLDERTREWFEREVRHRARPAALEAVQRHKEQGHHLVILTNASVFEASAAAKEWSFDHFLANDFHTDDDGRLTGTCLRPICYGQGKVERAEAWALEHGVAIDDAYFYTDSYSDLPMLERVSEPRVVSPDPRLRRAAKQREWPILDW
jgi:HAD superfamily hydrolase (TIGR01490 family)